MNLEVVDLIKKFDGNVILDHVSLKLEKGKIYGFVGRNGSGKSVLFKILCGFYQPDSGFVFIDSRDIHKEKEFLPNMRVFIEKPSFLGNFSGLENLQLLASIENKIATEDIVQTLKAVNFSETDIHKKYHKYSLGMKQKLGIAQVLMERPEIMILDEAFNGIEEETVEKIKNILKNNKQNCITIISSHIREDIEDLCDEVYQLKDGKVSKLALK